MAEKNAKRKTTASEQPPEPVSLKPVFGIQPGYYVAGILSGGALLILFLLLVYPGLKSNRGSIHIDSTPPGAAVYHDGLRLGATPRTFDLPRGTTEITLRRPGFRDATIEAEIPRRWFATLFFPAQISETVRMQPQERAVEQILNTAGNELTQWAALGESTDTRPLPPILTRTAYDLNAIDPGQTAGDISQFFLSSAQNITSAAMLRDLVHASWTRAAEAGGNTAPGALAAGDMVQNIIHLQNNSVGFLAWLESLDGTALHTRLQDYERVEQDLADNRALEDRYRNQYLETDFDNFVESSDSSENENAPRTEDSQPALTLAGVDFIRIPAGEVLLGFSDGLIGDDSEVTRVMHNTDEFYISRMPVTVDMWRDFLAERPEWRADRRAELITEGLAGSGYLRELHNQAEDEPVTHVSWHAASAFAEWMSERVGTHFNLALPSEPQWARAAFLDSFSADVSGRAFDYATGVRSVTPQDSRAGRLGIVDLLGNVWEWTRSPYYMADTRLRVTDSRLYSAGRSGYAVVRGGSWANDAERIGFETRGGQPKQWATPFLGFRLVAEEGAQ